ncbi:hypothetical protein R3P38DRAFT_1448194 [Favolaschia claudopus]|uniref:F-box domain-containing protein n=1 Tax=Favolaschia claudopus TaxID=2862362 RepID=A0AAW0APB3_9AGAR
MENGRNLDSSETHPDDPISNLPNEILSEVFLQFIPTYPECPPLLGPLSPTCLMLVCRRWLELSLALPMLWRAIEIADEALFCEEQIPVAMLWLERSKVYPLSLSLAKLDQFLSDKALATFTPHRARWEHLSLVYDWDWQGSGFLGREMPLLQSLRLGLRRWPDKVIKLPLAPLLHTLVFHRVSFSKLAKLPWNQITFFILDEVRESDCVQLLALTPNLVRCRRSSWNRPSAIFPDKLPSVVLVRLTDLDVACESNAFLDLFATPALRCLRLAYVQNRRSIPLHSLHSFISRSGCILEELHVVDPDRTEQDFRVEFPSIPTIVCKSAA